MGSTEEGVFETTIVPQVSSDPVWGDSWILGCPKKPQSNSLPESLWAFLGTGYSLMCKPAVMTTLHRNWLLEAVATICRAWHCLWLCHSYLQLPWNLCSRELCPIPTAQLGCLACQTPLLPATTTVSLQLSGGWKKVSVDNYFPGTYQGKWLCTCHLQAICKLGSIFNCLFNSGFQRFPFPTWVHFKPGTRAHNQSTPSFLKYPWKNNTGILLRGIVKYIWGD